MPGAANACKRKHGARTFHGCRSQLNGRTGRVAQQHRGYTACDTSGTVARGGPVDLLCVRLPAKVSGDTTSTKLYARKRGGRRSLHIGHQGAHQRRASSEPRRYVAPTKGDKLSTRC